MVAGCSGAATDRRHAMAMLAANHPNDPVDVIMGDWMSEANMTARAALKTDGMQMISRAHGIVLSTFQTAVKHSSLRSSSLWSQH